MWIPTTLDAKVKAQRVVELFRKYGEVRPVAVELDMAEASIYRYLKYMGVPLPERKRDEHGRYLSNK